MLARHAAFECAPSVNAEKNIPQVVEVQAECGFAPVHQSVVCVVHPASAVVLVACAAALVA